VFGNTSTGVEKVTCCQPLAVSPVNSAFARRSPVALQRLPKCVPVLAADL
jgi:hypothetical protein